jgi:cation diffusion facilitator CzcD-associated flavoprotein CzcO
VAVPAQRLDKQADVVIVGAGILGINQLYRAVEAGYSVQLLEQAGGVGGTWYWNRYPGCRFDSEIVKVTETGIETSDGLREFDIIIWATGFDFGSGALLRMGVVGTGGLRLDDYWANGPLTYLGIMAHGFPNLFFPGGPHGAAGNNPRYGELQVDFVQDLIAHARAQRRCRIEVPKEAEQAWMAMLAQMEAYSPFQKRGQYYGANTPGKPRAYLLNPGGRPKLDEFMTKAVGSGYQGFLA